MRGISHPLSNRPMNNSVSVTKAGEVTLVTLDRATVRNAVDTDTAVRLHQAFLEFDADPSARVAVFHGANGHFCAGWDLQAGAKMADAAQRSGKTPLENLEFQADEAQALGPMGPSRLHLGKPVVAAVCGAAVAGGMELALWCDMRVMEEDAYFGIYCRRFGVPLIDGGTVRLPRLIGQSHALDLILTGRPVKADEALRMGLANRVVAKGDSRRAAEELASQLAAFPQLCMNLDRASVYRQWELPFEHAMRSEFAHGIAAVQAEGRAGAARFAAGAGRGGKFGE